MPTLSVNETQRAVEGSRILLARPYGTLAETCLCRRPDLLVLQKRENHIPACGLLVARFPSWIFYLRRNSLFLGSRKVPVIYSSGGK